MVDQRRELNHWLPPVADHFEYSRLERAVPRVLFSCSPFVGKVRRSVIPAKAGIQFRQSGH